MCKIFVERKPLGVSMPEFWSWASTTGLHNTNEDFYHPIEETQVRIVIYGSNMLLTSKLQKQILEALDSLLFLLQ